MTSGGALHSLPTPVPRRNQKLSSPEYFDVVRKAKSAQEQAELTAMWLARNANWWYYPSTMVTTEFASIIACGAAVMSEG